MNNISIKILEYVRPLLYRYKYIILLFVVGVVLMLWSGISSEKAESSIDDPNENIRNYDIEKIEKSIEAIFKKIDGVGDVEVMINLKSGYESVYAYNSDESIIMNNGNYNITQEKEMILIDKNGTDTPIVLKTLNPQYLGAVIVCEGGGNSKIRLELTQAMKSLTGISSDNIVVVKMKK